MGYVSVGKDDNVVYLETAGELLFTHPAIKKVIEDPIILKKLRINSDGSFEIQGGSIPLPKSASLKLGPAKISITAIHCGTMERRGHSYKYWGFDGGLSVNPGGVDARGDGIKFCYRKDDQGKLDWFIHVEGIGIDLVIPGSASKEQAALLIQGYLSLKDPEYEGKIAFQMPKAKIAGGAHMKYNTKTPAFVIDAHLELPTAIPLASTGLGIYGFRGLFGLRYIASKTQEESWYDYYRKDPLGISISKMTTPDQLKELGHPPVAMKNPFTVGAGATIGTLPDDGFTFSMQLMLLVSIPTLIMLEGRAKVLGDRVGMTDDEPPLWAFVSFSPQDKSLEMGMGADYLIPKEGDGDANPGDVLDLSASLEAGYFFKDPSAWYLNFGTKSDPITAKIFRLFNAYSYLMLSAQGIEAGAGVNFSFDKKYPPVSISAQAYFDIWGYVSFERPQVGGGIAIGGSIDVRVAGVSLYIGLTTILTAEAAKPFLIQGSAELCVSINLLFFKLEECFTVKFKWERSKNVDMAPVYALEDASNGSPATGIHMQSGATYELAYKSGGEISKSEIDVFYQTPIDPDKPINDPLNYHSIIPLDTWIELQFAKALKPTNPNFPAIQDKIGGFGNPPIGDREIIPPRNSSRKVYHSYDLKHVEIQISNDGTNWSPYDPYEALGAPPTTVERKLGFWQKAGKEYNKIRFLGQTPFEYMNPVGGYIPEESGLSGEEMFCFEVENEEKKQCIDWMDEFGFEHGKIHFKNNAYFEIIGEDGAIEYFHNPFGFEKSLKLFPGSNLKVDFKEPTSDIDIKLSSCVNTVSVKYQRRELQINGHAANLNGQSQVSTTDNFITVKTNVLSKSQLEDPIIYTDTEHPIDRILIEPLYLNSEELRELEAILENLHEAKIRAQIIENADAITQIDEEISHVNGEIEKLENAFCSKKPNIRVDHLKEQIDAKNIKLKALIKALAKKQKEYDVGCPVRLKEQKAVLNDLYNEFKNPIVEPAKVKAIQVALKAGKITKKDYASRLNKISARGKILEKETSDIAVDIRINFKEQKKKCDNLLQEIRQLSETIKTLEHEKISLQATIDKLLEAQDESDCCSTYIHEICWLTKSQREINNNLPTQNSINEDFSDMVETINEITPIWKPEHYFRIILDVQDSVSLQNGTPSVHEKRCSIGFKTGKPIGFFNEIAEIEEPSSPEEPALDNVPQSPESRLSFYIDDRRSYPDPTGNILYSKPLYYESAKINLAFNKRYVSHFFGYWPPLANSDEKEFALDIKIIDPARVDDPGTNTWQTPLTDPDETHVANITASDDMKVPQGIDIAMLQKMYSVPDPCRPSAANLEPKGKRYEVDTQNLSPLKTYTAVMRNQDKTVSGDQEYGEVHRFPFLSSRYSGPEAHVKSYERFYPNKEKAKETGQAVFTELINLGMTPGAINGKIADAAQMIIDPSLGDTESFPDVFERIYHKVLGIPEIGAAQSTEFTFLQVTNPDGSPGNTFGLLIRSDEPFNDPRLTAEELEGTIKVKQAGIEISDYQMVMSKDRTQALIVVPSTHSIPLTDITIGFDFKRWEDGELAPYLSIDTDVLEV